MPKLANIFRPKIQAIVVDGGAVPVPPASAGANDAGAATTGEAAGDVRVELKLETPQEGELQRSEESKALHRLLVNTSRKIDDLDVLKSALDDMVLPFRGAMRALDQERVLTSSLSRQLGENVAVCDKLRDELQHAENKARQLETEAENLRTALDQARESSSAMENARALLSDEIKKRDAKIAAIEQALEHEALQRRGLSDSWRTMQERTERAEKRAAELQDALGAALQKCESLKHEKRSLWRSAEQAREEAERVNRRLAEGEGALGAIRAELGKVEARYAEICDERNRLADAADELGQQQQAERQRFDGRIEALESRVAAADRLVAEMRHRLIERTEEARAFICKAAEATIARATAERRLAALEVSQGLRDRISDDSAESRTALSEYLRALNLKSREMALAGAAEKLAALTERKGYSTNDSRTKRSDGDTREEESAAGLESGRLRRTEIEKALEITRQADARLASEVASLTSGLLDVVGVSGRPKAAMPDAADRQSVSARKRSKTEPLNPGSAESERPGIERPEERTLTVTGHTGALAYEAGLVARLRRPSEEDDPARSVA